MSRKYRPKKRKRHMRRKKRRTRRRRTRRRRTRRRRTRRRRTRRRRTRRRRLAQSRRNFFSTLKKYRAAKHKTPTSFSVFPDKSPQLQKPGEYTKLNEYTTKNVAVRESSKVYNAIINDRLAYKRQARGQLVHRPPNILYGPSVFRLTKDNYKKLKKGMKLYYDRGSVILRGPFVFEKVIRGPELIFSVKDTAYNRTYKFSLSVDQLEREKMYFITKKK